MFKKFDFFSDKVKYNGHFFSLLQIYNEKAQFSSPQSKEAAIKAEKRLILVPVTFILIRIWGTLRFILYTFAGVHSLNTTYGTVFLYLQVSLL